MNTAAEKLPDAARAPRHHALDSGDFAILKRLARDYLGGRIGTLALAIFCMVVAAATNGILAWLVGPVIKEFFHHKQAQMVLILPLVVVAVVTIRALATFGQEVV